MTFSRNDNRAKFNNNNDLYRYLRQKKKVDFIAQYKTMALTKDLNIEEKIKYFEYEWKTEDKFYKLAQKYYNDSRLWWIIAHFNNTPTEHSISIGQTIKIPESFNLEETLELLGY